MLHAWQGGRSLTELSRAMPAWERPYWFALEKIVGPLGPVRGDLQAGAVAAQAANLFRGKNQEPASAWDFVPDFSGELRKALKAARKRQLAERMIRKAKAMKAVQDAERNSDGGSQDRPG